ncbi:ScyD/ScyE family protein [Nocardioides sediminis]|uniref:ScyD/ScyE family protein n=1 Tax=Nocardioides sediminis TaxID=433648 RepID=UPI00131F4499|nr:ScyD/ScyE family protein [Nocardioides sediminis]
MHRSRVSLALALATVASTALATVLSAPARAGHPTDQPTDPPWTTVASGLDNPRHLTFAGHSLYVAEAGRGGTGPCIEGPEGPDGPEVCFGLSGAITRVNHWGQERVVSGLPSLAEAEGTAAIGPSDVAAFSHHRYVATIGLGAPPEKRATFGEAGAALGTVVTGHWWSGKPRVAADLAAYEEENDPDGNGPDSNPTGMLLERWSAVVTDSGGNTLLRVKPGGKVETLAVFPDTDVPNPPFLPPGTTSMQAVPTSVVRGYDGAYYVSQLTGFPFPAGGSSIWRVVPGEEPTVWATGLTNVTDLAWYHGSLYAVQISAAGLLNEPEGALPTGSLVRIEKGKAPETVAEGLPAPYGVALRRGNAYVTTCAVCPGGGSVVSIDLW